MDFYIEKTKLDDLIKIKGMLFLVIFMRILMVAYTFEMGNRFDELSFGLLFLLAFLTFPYMLAEVVLFINKEKGMHFLLGVSGVELLFDLASLIFCKLGISLLPDGYGWSNTLLSSLVYLYFGIRWNAIFKWKKEKITVPRKYIRYLNDLLVTVVIVIMGGYGYIYGREINAYLVLNGFNAWWVEFRIVAFVMLLECLLIKIDHYWKWAGFTIGAISIIIAKKDAGLFILIAPYNGFVIAMTAVASLVYIIKKFLAGNDKLLPVLHVER